MNSISVTVLTPHGRRQNINISPSMTLLQVLEEVCKKYDFNSENYCLKHHNKEIDLSLMFRFSGLPNKCFLEMDECTRKREDSDVVICMQLEDGTRNQGQFLPNQSLNDVLKTLSPSSLEEGNPVIVYMRSEIYGDNLEKTTLRSLGITKGRAMFRVLNKNPKDLKNQASVYVPPTKISATSEDKVEAKLELKPEDNMTNTKTIEKNNKKDIGITTDKIRNLIPKQDENEPKTTAPMEVEEKSSEVNKDNEAAATKKVEYDWGSSVGRKMNDEVVSLMDNENERNEETIEEPEIFELGERNAVLFSLDTAQKVTDDLPDSFFDLTVDDLKVLLRDLHKQASGNEDAPLLTAKLREIEESNRTLRKLSEYKKSVIRIQFPDRMVLQGTFSPIDKIEDIYDFVRNYLKNPDLKFYLFTIPPKKILDKNLTLVEANLVPTAVLHFGVDEIETMDLEQQQGFLKEGLQQTSANGATIAASKSRGIIMKQQQEQERCEDTAGAGSSNRTTPLPCTGAIPKQFKKNTFKKSSSESGEKVPKWFKTFQK